MLTDYQVVTGTILPIDGGWVAFTQAFHSSSHSGRYMGMPCGIVLHTGLGRAPLAEAALQEVVAVGSGYASVDTQTVNQAISTNLRLGAAIDGTLDELVLCAVPLSASTITQASINFRELL